MRKPWQDASDTPWWAQLFTKAAAPYAVVAVLILCAPGEQHLAQMAGWTSQLSWLYASLLAAYAGVSARIAVTRKPGDRGYHSAVVGAAVALLLAMAAQPVAHLFVTGWLSATPRTPVWLVIIVSSTPPLVLGHLLHFAGRPDSMTQAAGRRTATPAQRTAVSAPAVRPSAPALPQQSAERGQAVPAVSATRTDMSVALDKAVSAPADNAADTGGQSNVSQIGQAHGLAALVRALHTDGLSEADIRAEVLRQFPDTKTDTLGKTIRRELGPRHARTA